MRFWYVLALEHWRPPTRSPCPQPRRLDVVRIGCESLCLLDIGKNQDLSRNLTCTFHMYTSKYHKRPSASLG